ncbi:MAG: hypothetical protein IKZ61_10325 [Prevotella sp.]|nr:hypothetical protein [Prevotella sp.]
MKRIRYLLIAVAAMINTAASAQTKNIAERKYWLDGNITQAQDLTVGHATIDISSLEPGLHSLSVRVQDTEGLWSSQVAKYFIKPFANNSESPNGIAQHQYWIDGNLQTAITSGSKPQPIAISSLTPGLHTFTVRVQDLTGVWSSQVAKCFIVPYKETSVGNKEIVQHQYWIDGKIEARVTKNSSIDIIDIEPLSTGLHSFTVRVKDNTGVWSSQVAKYFIVPYKETSVDDKEIVQHQYWIDGNLNAIVSSETQPDIIDIEALKSGLHSLTVRVKDNTGVWSSQVAKYFIVPYSETAVGDKSIVLHQYWIDGNLNAIVSSETQPDIIDIETLTPGLHSLTVRVKDNTGVWSSQVAKYFIVKDEDTMEDVTISRYMYWFDDNSNDFTTGSLSSATGTMNIDISEVEAGTHTLWWRCGDSKGAWSEPRSVTFESRSFYDYTVPASGVGTFSADVNLTLPDGLQAHFCTYLKEVEEGLAIKIISIDGNVISANTGMLLSGTGGETYRLRYTSEAGATNETNKLVPVVESVHVNATDGEYTNFMMQGGKFVKILEEDESVMMPAHRAYLPLLTSEVANAKYIGIIWDDDTVTGLDGVPTDDNRDNRYGDGTIYNLQGQKVDNPTRGIYIINGKKVVIK